MGNAENLFGNIENAFGNIRSAFKSSIVDIDLFGNKISDWEVLELWNGLMGISCIMKDAYEDIGDYFNYCSSFAEGKSVEKSILEDIRDNFYSLADREGIIHLEVLTSI